jgi:hypothetical protein
MLYREIIAVCSEIHTKQINTVCGLNVELLNVYPDGTYNKHGDLNGINPVPLLRNAALNFSSTLFYIHAF